MTNQDYPTVEMEELFNIIVSLKNTDEAVKFFRDLLTVSEIKEFSNRWQMVKMIDRGMPYLDIAKKLGVSTTTVSRVAHWLHHGMGGYQLALKNNKSQK